MRKLLVTGYQAFSGRSRNGSEVVARALSDYTLGEFSIESVILPVVWDEVGRFVDEKGAGHYVAGVFLGEGNVNLNSPVVELLAHNKVIGTDEGGMEWSLNKVEPGGPDVLPSTFMCGRDDEELTTFSRDAGQYLCNFLLYKMLRKEIFPCVFIHLPILGELDEGEYVDEVMLKLVEMLDMGLREL